MTELNANGQKRKSYIYLGAERLAEQEGGFVVWKHTNPLTGSEGSSFLAGQYGGEKEPDPMLVNVGFDDPYLNFEEPNPDSMQLLGGNSNGQCTVEGMTWDCMSAHRLREIGVAEEMVSSTVFAIYGNGTARAIWSGPVSTAGSWTAESTSSVDEVGGTGSNGHAPDTGFVVLGGTSDSSVTVIAGAAYAYTGPQDPQRLTPEQHKILRKDFENLLRGRKDCLEFAKRLLLTVAINTGRPLYDNSFLDDPVRIFDEIEKQGGIALDPTNRFGGSASGSFGKDDKLEAKMLLKEVHWGGFGFVRGAAVFHESVHFGPAFGVFSDRELAWAGYEVLYSMGYTLPPPPSTGDDIANSKYFEYDLIFRACNPFQQRR